MNRYIVFIISNGRPNNVVTYKTLRNSGYTGRIAIIVDNEDKTVDQYINNYQNEVYVFDKKHYASLVDSGDNFNNFRTTTYARNYAFDLAKQLGYEYFLVLDDDYTSIAYKFTADLDYKHNNIKTLNSIFDSVFTFLINTPTTSIALAQGGDFIGGSENSFAQKLTLKRKCMNSFFCSTKRRFNFVSRLNEDVNTYMTLGNRGFLFFTLPQCYLTQKQTQTNKGGMSEAYLTSGTYVKSFYTVMYCPSFTKISPMGRKFKRLHHKILWKNAVPMLLNEKYKK